MSKSGRVNGLMWFLNTLLLGSVLGAGGVIAVLLLGPQWVRGLVLSSQPQQSSPIASNPQLSASPITGNPSLASLAAPASQQVAFEDIKGVFGEKEITQLGQLGVFDTATGKFNPQQPITRAEFMRWLFHANNALWFDQPNKIIREAEGGQATFTDVPTTHADFRYIQGLTNTGFVVGFNETTFRPDELLTCEQLIAIKIGVDIGGISTSSPQFTGRNWTDKDQISKQFVQPLNQEFLSFGSNVERTFGAIKTFKPQTPVTRAEAAVCISAIGDHTILGHYKSNFRTTKQALQLKAEQKTSSP